MKTLLITSLGVLILLCCVPCKAVTGEIAVADWERDEDGAIWSDYVLGEQSAFSDEAFTLNAFCDSRTVERASLMRSELYSILEKDISNNVITGTTAALADLLEQYALRGIVPIQSREKSVIVRIRLARKAFRDEKDAIASQEDKNEKALMPLSAMTVLNPNTNKSSSKKYNRDDGIPANSSFDKVNLAEYALDSDKVDHFQLFLYLWEDNPFERGGLDIQSPLLPVNHAPAPSNIFHLPTYPKKAKKPSIDISVNRAASLQKSRQNVNKIFLSGPGAAAISLASAINLMFHLNLHISIYPWRIPCYEGAIS